MSAEKTPHIYTLPLFPLHSVLFPQFLLQLYIFEERYKVMINGCVEHNRPFGVILIREGDEVGRPARPFEVGCVTRILGVQRLEDGRMNLLAAGENRFRLIEYMEADLPYLLGRVEEFEDDEVDAEELGPLTRELNEGFMRYLNLLAAQVDEPVPNVELPDDPSLLTFCVASVAMMPMLDKQHLLEMTDPRLRLELELQWLTEQIDALEALSTGGEMEGMTGSDPPLTVMVARPLDVHGEPWQQYYNENRN
jgi:Lon protease-like protein